MTPSPPDAGSLELDQPVTHVLVDVPDCRMSGSFVLGDERWEYLFRLGAPRERAMLQFMPAALRRFVALATDLMALPLPARATDDPPELLSPPKGADNHP